MGDIEMWELVKPMIYLGRRIKPYTGGVGRHRGGSSFESLLLVHGTPDFEIENIGAGGMFTSPGLFGGYPGAERPTCTTSTARTSSSRRPRARPTRSADVGGEAPAARARSAASTMLKQRPVHDDDAPSSTATCTSRAAAAAAASATRCCAPRSAVDRRRRRRHLIQRFAESGLRRAATATRYRAKRLERARPASEWWAEQRQRILDGDLIEPVQVMFASRCGSSRTGPPSSAASGTCRRTSTSTRSRRPCRSQKRRAGQGHPGGVGRGATWSRPRPSSRPSRRGPGDAPS